MQIDSDINSALFSRFLAAGLGITASPNCVCLKFKQREHDANFEPWNTACVYVKMLRVHASEFWTCRDFKVTMAFWSAATGCSSVPPCWLHYWGRTQIEQSTCFHLWCLLSTQNAKASVSAPPSPTSPPPLNPNHVHLWSAQWQWGTEEGKCLRLLSESLLGLFGNELGEDEGDEGR